MRQLAAFSSFAQTLADKIRTFIAQAVPPPLMVETKADEDPVTRADREVEQALREAIAAVSGSRHAGEEYGQPWRPKWV